MESEGEGGDTKPTRRLVKEVKGVVKDGLADLSKGNILLNNICFSGMLI